MTDDAFTDAGAQALRRAWFSYLDTVAAVHGPLHAFCLKLTGNVWDAEDLVQDTLLRGFAMTARGDFHGPDSPVRDARAYLLRTATNLWLDHIRRGRWWGPLPEQAEPAADDPDPVATAEAIGSAAALTNAREFAALVLKEAFDFSLREVADFIGTTEGTVKSLLSRARRKLRAAPVSAAPDPAQAQVVRALVEAMNARDETRILELMAETVKIDVCNVGGGRGRTGIWTGKTLAGTRFEYAEHEGAPLVLLFGEGDRVLRGVVRPEVADAAVIRLVDYHYAPETLRLVAAALGFDCRARGYHQGDAHLPDMIATTALPWRTGG